MAASNSPALSSADYAVYLNADGCGHSQSTWLALTRPDGQSAAEQRGFGVYLRDLDDPVSAWSPSAWPLGAALQGQQQTPDALIFRAQQGTLEACWQIRLADTETAEWRSLSLRNHGSSTRRIEITSYLEPVLHHPAADAAHPAFAKLFVQTEQVPALNALLCSRRPRGHGEVFPWLVHGVVGAAAAQWETDRMRFIGRGRNLQAPAALDGTLSGTVGNVLDPVLSLRCIVELAAGAELNLAFYLGVAPDRAQALALAERLTAHTPRAVRSAPPLRSAALRSTAPRRWARDAMALPTDPNALQFYNGYGGFSADGDEYVILLQPDANGRLRQPPLPWTNAVSNPRLGFLVSETGAGYTWSRNSRQHRLTPWSNDPVLDPHGEALYLQEDATHWSPLPGPCPAGAYEVRHGFGYSRWSHHSQGLDQQVWQFVDRDDPIKITRLCLHNLSDQPRRLCFSAYLNLVLAVLPEESIGSVFTRALESEQVLLAENANALEFADGVAFAALLGCPGAWRYTTDRHSFLGAELDVANPAWRFDQRHGAVRDACFALQGEIELAPGERWEGALLFGEVTSTSAALELVRRYRQPQAVTDSLARAREFWKTTVTTVQVKTPLPAVDLMMNGWLVYQNLSCRIWGRSAFYQSGGAYGYRDQLQDAAALIHLRPDLTRAQILLNASHQFIEGDVLHWWHPAPMETGLRTRFADDLLWLPLLTAYYVRTTGDTSVLDQRAAYLQARLLEDGEDETYFRPESATEEDDVYGHCCRAIERALNVGMGAHGLPLFGTGDWNDGMSRVGREGRGESVWMGFFLYSVLGEFAAVCEQRGDAVRALRYQAVCNQLSTALNDTAWDGDWYRRAYYDDGAVMGSKDSDECRIDALAQAWAVISGAAPRERAEQAMNAAERELISDADQLIRLLTPPFENTPHDPGYIKGYVKGVRENGGQYTHAACWVVRALAELGRHQRAAELIDMLSPISHSLNAEAVARYQVEPYVIAADIYGAEPHVGRGGWTWYTGSAGWYYRVVLESLLGVELLNGKTLRLNPRIPADWLGFQLDYRPAGLASVYHLDVRQVTDAPYAELDGAPLAIAADGALNVPLVEQGSHTVTLLWERKA